MLNLNCMTLCSLFVTYVKGKLSVVLIMHMQKQLLYYHQQLLFYGYTLHRRITSLSLMSDVICVLL